MSDSPGWAPPGSPPPEDYGPHHPRPAPNPGQTNPGQTPDGGTEQSAPRGWDATPPSPSPTPAPGSPDQLGEVRSPVQPAGWGGWHPAPPAPKPGVIPLRPLGVGEILDGAVTTARAHWRTALTIALSVAVVTQLVSALAMRLWVSDSPGLAALQDTPEPTAEQLRAALGDLFAYGSVSSLVTLLGTVLATAMLTIVVSRAVLGQGVTIGEAWQDSRDRLLRLLGLVVLVPLLAALAFATPFLVAAASGDLGLTTAGFVGGVVLGVWLWVRLSLAAPALMLERQGVGEALRRSWKLVRGSWWRVFGIQLLIVALVTVVSGIIEVPTSALAGLLAGDGADAFVEGDVTEMTWTYLAVTGVGAVLAATVTLPISAGVTALLYIDQRIRREALDLELARAAGVDPQAPGA